MNLSAIQAPEHLGRAKPENAAILQWVEETAALCQPENIFWCDGSDAEDAWLKAQAVAMGVLIPLHPTQMPGCYLHRSATNDVARIEQFTYICTEREEEAGPTNNWAEPKAMHEKLAGVLAGAMRGRTLFVVPYMMGPAGSPMTKVGIEITDSIYVVLNMRIMARMGLRAYEHLVAAGGDFNRGLHSVLDCNPERRYICHFPSENAIISVGSGYGGNVLLGKKCLALRIGSVLGRDEGWMAEHMLLLCVQSPDGEKSYVAAAFPSACGKTNFAMLIPPAHFAGWKVTTIGDDIAWMRPGADGRLYAINPEAGYFGVVPGTNSKSNANAMKMIQRDTIYTNVALKPDGTVWWEGHDDPPPAECIDWRGNPWTPASPDKAAHPNSRFTTPMRNNPALAEEAEWKQGVPIDAIIFGGRRATTMPLVVQAFNWSHGVFLGASMGSEMTAAAAGTLGQVRRDPMAMLPFCGYNMALYFRHWLNMRKKIKYPPLIFHVNWFRKDAQGEFLWPGYSENMRVLKWMIDRCRGNAGAYELAVGWAPRWEEFDVEGLPDFDRAKFEAAQRIDKNEWAQELLLQNEIFFKLYERLPKELVFQRELLMSRL
jgi:phosphoenolpyruvate carboxykinase (GTP)